MSEAPVISPEGDPMTPIQTLANRIIRCEIAEAVLTKPCGQLSNKELACALGCAGCKERSSAPHTEVG